MATLSRLKPLQRQLPFILLKNVAKLSLARSLSRSSVSPRSFLNNFLVPSIITKCNQQNRTISNRTEQTSSTKLISSVDFFDDEPGHSASYTKPKKNVKILMQQFNDENKYIHKYVQRKLVDSKDLASKVSSLSIKPLVDELVRFASAEHADEQEYKETRSDFFRKFKSHIRGADLNELVLLMTYIKESEKSEVRVVKKMIDVELEARLRIPKRRITSNDLDNILYIADVFFQYNTTTTFISELISRCAIDGDIILKDRQLMYMLFVIILAREDKGFLSRYETRILRLLKEPTFEDIVVICLSYFKTKTRIGNLTMQKQIFNQTLKFLPTIDYTQPGYCAIIKCMRYSRNFALKHSAMALINKVTQDQNSSKILDSNFNLTQTAKFMETYRIYDQQMLDKLRVSIFRDSNEFRIKDIQYVLSTLSNFKWNDLQLDDSLKQDFDTLCQSIVAETRLDEKFFHSHLFPLFRSFITFGYYNDEFINYVNGTLEDDEKLTRMQALTLDFEKSFLLAYAATRLESSGAKLLGSPELLSRMSESIKRIGSSGSIKKDSSFGHLGYLLHGKLPGEGFVYSEKMRSIAKSLNTMEGLDSPKLNFNFQYTMAHQNYADLVISVERPAPGQFDSRTLMPKQMGANEKHCLVFAVQNADFMDGCDRLSGFKELIMRLLMRLGYNVVVFNLDEPDIDKLASQIKSVLQDQEMKLPSDGVAKCDRL